VTLVRVILVVVASLAMVGCSPQAPPTDHTAALNALMSDPDDPATCVVSSTDPVSVQYICTWAMGAGEYGPGNPTDYKSATVLLFPDGSYQFLPGGPQSSPGAVFAP
jgi:hypothetical protein